MLKHQFSYSILADLIYLTEIAHPDGLLLL